jgi:hypothetical protein
MGGVDMGGVEVELSSLLHDTSRKIKARLMIVRMIDIVLVGV